MSIRSSFVGVQQKSCQNVLDVSLAETKNRKRDI